MTPGEAGGKGYTMNFKPRRGATNDVFRFATFGALGHILSNYPVRRGARGHHGVASSRPLVTLLNLNLITQKATIPMNNVES